MGVPDSLFFFSSLCGRSACHRQDRHLLLFYAASPSLGGGSEPCFLDSSGSLYKGLVDENPTLLECKASSGSGVVAWFYIVLNNSLHERS